MLLLRCVSGFETMRKSSVNRWLNFCCIYLGQIGNSSSVKNGPRLALVTCQAHTVLLILLTVRRTLSIYFLHFGTWNSYYSSTGRTRFLTGLHILRNVFGFFAKWKYKYQHCDCYIYWIFCLIVIVFFSGLRVRRNFLRDFQYFDGL